MFPISCSYRSLPETTNKLSHRCGSSVLAAQLARPSCWRSRFRGKALERCKHVPRYACSASSGQRQADQESVAPPSPTDPRLQHAQDALRQQQQQSSPPVSLPVAKSLVETAMLAAVSGLAYTLATLLKLESYLDYFLPMPVIVAAMRSGPAAGRKTMTATCFLLLLLLGPIRAVTYIFMHGLPAVCLGALWHWRAHWGITLVTGSIIRLLGTLGYLGVTSWTLNEDLFSLLLANVYSLLDRIAGGSGTPSPLVVAVVIACLLAFNSTLHVCVMHAVYIPLLQGMGYTPTQLPKFVQKIIMRRQGQLAQQ